MARVTVKVPAPAQPAVATQSAPNPAPAPVAGKNNLMYLFAGVAVLLVLVVVVVLAALLHSRNQLQDQVNQLSASATSGASSDVKKYQAEIGKIVELPASITPTLVPVKDAAKLAADNEFFKRAKNGDVVLLYLLPDKTVTAVLYRPSTHKVVELTSNASIGANSTTP